MPPGTAPEHTLCKVTASRKGQFHAIPAPAKFIPVSESEMWISRWITGFFDMRFFRKYKRKTVIVDK
jgi:hypothetical protein